MKLVEIPDYHIEKMTRESFEETGRVYRRVFAEQEPLIVHLGLTITDMETMFKTNYYQALKTSEVTAIARDARNANIVGLRFAGDLSEHVNTSIMDAFEAGAMRLLDWQPRLFSSIVDLIYPNSLKLAAYGILEKRLIQEWLQKYCPSEIDPSQKGQVVKMMGVAVLAEHQGYQLGQHMTLLTHELARQKGYRYAVVTCTNVLSQRIFERLGYQLRYQIEYDHFRFAQDYPFRGVMNTKKTKREYYSNVYDFKF